MLVSASAQELPGPSQDLFNSPFYTCTRNFYVATNGSDSNPGTQASPWQHIWHADATPVRAGDCINVQPGSYDQGAVVTRGGNAPTPTGYVVYRCTQLNACVITACAGPDTSFYIATPNNVGPSFVVIDGFKLAANSYCYYGSGITIGNAQFTNADGPDHIWVLNSIIHGYGQGGISTSQGEYFYFIHNTAYDNSRVTCDAQGSGISIWEPRPVPGYTPSGMDLTFAPPFHNVVRFNVTNNNAVTQCGTAAVPYDTDGNGIIMDSFKVTGYPHQTLVAFNVSYNNGGSGMHLVNSSNVTFANNTAFNNQIDPFNNGSIRWQIGVIAGDNNVIINNVAYGVPATTASDPRCQGTQPCSLTFIGAFLGASFGLGTDDNNVWHNNVSFIPGSSNGSENDMFDGDAGKFDCTMNRCSTDPLFVAPSSTTTLATSINDLGNFALQPGSPALGYAQPQSYLPPWTRDAGACDSSIAACPYPGPAVQSSSHHRPRH
jgi:parallel beta-helix repeat protein